jgi:glycosyltransferase involved in cell wall biosynthesis
MRILFLVHQYLPEHVGGVELYTRWLAQALSQRDHQVTVFYRRSAKEVGLEQRTEGGLQIWAAWNGLLSPTRRFLVTFRDPLIAGAFERVLEQTRPDLVHVQHLMGLPAALSRSIHRQGLPFVITLWDFWWVCANAQLLTNYSQQICDGPRAYLNCARCALARAGYSQLWPALPVLAGPLARRNHLLREIMQAAGCLFAPTAFVRDWYKAHGAPAQNLIVVPAGLDYPVRGSPLAPRSEAPLRFVYIGGLAWQKGVHILLEAFKGIRDRAELWIAGDESADPDYVARLHAQAPPNVRFLGKLAREKVWETLAQVDVVTVPSMWYETFSFLVSEAFAAGAPVIASRLGPLAGRVRDGVDGLLVPPGDVAAWRTALQRLVDETDLLPRLRANVRPPTTLDEHVEQIEALYAQVISKSQR